MKRHLIFLLIAWSTFVAVASLLPFFARTTPRVIAAAPCAQPPAKTPNSAKMNLDQAAKHWGIYCEQKPQAAKGNVATPSLDGKAFRCALLGARKPYSNVHCYRNLLPEPAARAFTLTLSFYYSPTTTFNNDPDPSVVQAIEFSLNKYHQGKRYEIALQWQNVRGEAGEPQWRYWDGTKIKAQRWIAMGITEKLTGETWHTLSMSGEIRKGKTHYTSFTVDGNCHALDLTARAVTTTGEPDRLAVGIQLDGNQDKSPYELIVDQVNFTRASSAIAPPYCP